jgi:hypothetical protein
MTTIVQTKHEELEAIYVEWGMTAEEVNLARGCRLF